MMCIYTNMYTYTLHLHTYINTQTHTHTHTYINEIETGSKSERTD